MTIEELKEEKALYFSKIQEGFEGYSWESRKLNADQALELFRKLRAQAGEGKAFLDFYYFAITEEERKKAGACLSEKEKRFLDEYQRIHSGADWSKELIFPMTDQFLEPAVKLNHTEALFSTMYFGGEEKTTWWGNYGGEYVRFEKA